MKTIANILAVVMEASYIAWVKSINPEIERWTWPHKKP
jgi:CelD/BcsL family acetyltransferase involved in cellulose biosynthesis